MSRHLGDVEYPQYVQWLHYANGTLQPALSMVGALVAANAQDSPIGKIYCNRGKNPLKILDDRLSRSKYLVGDEVTAADAMTVYSLSTGRGFNPLDLTGYDNILRYLRDVVQRPAYKEANSKGDAGMEPMIKPVERRFTHFEVLRNMTGDVEK